MVRNRSFNENWHVIKFAALLCLEARVWIAWIQKPRTTMLASVASKAKALGHSWVARSLCSNADIFRSPAQMQAQILRFQDEFGQEHFGVPEDDFRARIVQRSEKTGKLEHSNLTVGVMEILPPVEPIAIYGVGLNYRDHAAETGKEVPRFPSRSFAPRPSN